jgi:hypothetical protein
VFELSISQLLIVDTEFSKFSVNKVSVVVPPVAGASISKV